MAPLNLVKDPTLLESDSEDDDFTLEDAQSDSSSDSEEEKVVKKRKVEAVVEPTLSKADVDDLWASFNEDPVASTSATGSSGKVEEKRKKIKITTSYIFVGETVVQEKEVWNDSPEAILYLEKEELKKLQKGKGKAEVTTSLEAKKLNDLFGEEEVIESTSTVPIPVVEEKVEIKPVEVKKTGPPKRAQSSLAALAEKGKVAKLNTLEKSKLDWNNFVVKSDLTEDLSKARKDGYLDKQDFLQRTEDRKELDYEAVKAARSLRKQPPQ